MAEDNTPRLDAGYGRNSLKGSRLQAGYLEDYDLKKCYHHHAFHYVSGKYDEQERKYPMSFSSAISLAIRDLGDRITDGRNFLERFFGTRACGIGPPRYSADRTIEMVAMGGDFDFDGRKIRASVYLRPSDKHPYQIVSVFTRPGEYPSKIFDLINEYVTKKNPLRNKVINLYGIEEDFGVYGWDDIALPQGFRQEIEQNLLWPIQHNTDIRSANLRVPRGVLLEGELGTGKTLLSEVVANEVKGHGTFIKARPSDISGVGWDYTFEVARALGPSILYIEDIETFTPGTRSPSQSAFLTDFLDYLDGTGERGEVMVLVSSNSPEFMDPRMIDRPGRIDRRLTFDPANRETFGLEWKERTLEIHLQERRLEEGLSPRDLAKMIEGALYTGAHIRELIHTATLEALGVGTWESAEMSNVTLTRDDFKRADERIRSNYRLDGKTD